MDHRVPRIGVVISLVLAVGALITFLYLNSRFEGPDPVRLVHSPYELTARFENTKKLPTKQPVLYKGISVGRVTDVTWDASERVGLVTFTVDEDFEIRDDAVLQIGERSLLGDPYLNVVDRGSEGARPLDSGEEVERTRASVNFDEALDFLDEEGRERVRSLIDTIAAGTSPAGNGERLNNTVGGLTRTVDQLHELTRALRGQEEQIAGLVTSASTVLSELGRREQSVRTIVASGRSTLDALASNTASLDEALVELPLLLEAGRDAMREARPLVAEARPLAAKLRGLAPDLATALDPRAANSLTEIGRNLVATIEALRPLRRVAEPVLGEATELMEGLEPLTHSVAPAARNLVPALEYLTPRVDAISGLYALVGAMAQGEDHVGNYTRSGFNLDPAELIDTPLPANCDPATQDVPPNQGFCFNTYPKPGDAVDPQPFEPPYPRLVPCKVPPRSTPRAPCE